MAKKDSVKSQVEAIVEKFKEDQSTRYSSSNFRELVRVLLTDREYMAKVYKYTHSKKEKKVSEVNYAKCFDAFLDTIFKHADIKSPEERAKLIESFDLKNKDIAFFIDAIDEAEYLWMDSCGKTLIKWINKETNLLVSKYIKKGKYEGEVGIRRRIRDNEKKLAKKEGTGKPVPKKK